MLSARSIAANPGPECPRVCTAHTAPVQRRVCAGIVVSPCAGRVMRLGHDCRWWRTHRSPSRHPTAASLACPPTTPPPRRVTGAPCDTRPSLSRHMVAAAHTPRPAAAARYLARRSRRPAAAAVAPSCRARGAPQAPSPRRGTSLRGARVSSTSNRRRHRRGRNSKAVRYAPRRAPTASAGCAAAMCVGRVGCAAPMSLPGIPQTQTHE